jgi:hypothetical protein
VWLSARRFVHGARLAAAGYEPDDDAFSLEPGVERSVRLRARSGEIEGSKPKISLTALNLSNAALI